MSGIDLTRLAHSMSGYRNFAAGETIIAAGERPGTEMFIIRKGRVGIRVGERQIEEVGPGGIVGEMALLDRNIRSAEAVAIEPTEVLPIDERVFIILVQETPGFAVEVMRVLAARLRRMNEFSESGHPAG